MQTAIDNLDIKTITEITAQANSAKGNYESTTRAITDLTAELQKGGREALQYLDELERNSEAADKTGKVLTGSVVGGVEAVGRAMEERKLNIDAYRESLKEVIVDTQKLKLAEIDLEGQRNENRLAGAVMSKQNDLDLAAQQALLQIEQQRLKIKDQENDLAVMKVGSPQYMNLKDEIEQSERMMNVLRRNATIAKREASAVGQILMTVNNSFQSSLAASLQGLIQGTMSVKDAFKNMALGILNALSQIIAELMVVALVRQLALGGIGGGVSDYSVGDTGAIISGTPAPPPVDFGKLTATMGNPTAGRYGGVFKEYSTGGIARGTNAGYPAILHGTEAVVPLPNGNAIPVEMRDGGGSTNNVSITVNMNEGGSNSEQSGITPDQAGQLGKMLSAAVQEELQNQKRPGGILSPYGAA